MRTPCHETSELFAVLESTFYAIVRVDPDRDLCWFEKGVSGAHRHTPYSYNRMLRASSKFIFSKYRSHVLNVLSPAHLRTLCFSSEFTLNFAYKTFDNVKWVSINFVHDKNTGLIYLLFRHCSEYDVVLKDIVNIYVYERCDFFIYLDAKTNSYVMFSASSNGTPLPTRICDDYEREVVLYADMYVVPEDKEMVIAEMGLKHVVEMLDRNGVHSLYVGVVDPLRGYTRKKIEFQYYNRELGKILLWRTDISRLYNEEMERNAKLREALERAQTDSMTGLLNKQAFEEKVGDALKDNQYLAAFLFVDLDNFKAINDSFGHSTGDRVIQALAKLLRKETEGRQALVGRVGGDEFAVFLDRLDAREDACRLARAICDGVASLDGTLCAVSCSIGVAFFPDEATNYADLAEKADKRTYAAKASGKNGYNASE